MTQNTDYHARLEGLKQRVASERAAAQARVDISGVADSARAKWAQLRADAAARMSDVKTDIGKHHRQVDAKLAAKDADWAEADAAGALDFADWAVENAQLTVLEAINARAHADNLAEAAAAE